MFNAIRINYLEDGTEITVEGSPFEILTDLTVVIRHVYTGFIKGGMPKIMANLLVRQSMDLALMGRSQMEELAHDALNSLFEDISNASDDEEREKFNELLKEVKEELKALKNE